MRGGRRVAAVVPCRDEEAFVAGVVRELPAWVDHVVVVDDASTDGTGEAARATGDGRVEVMRLSPARGVGGATVAGLARARASGAEVLLVTNGDGQMAGDEAAVLVDPVVAGRADLVKGDRLLCPGTAGNIPWQRRAGIALLGFLTARATGSTRTGDAQSGYFALSAEAASRLPLDALWPRHGFPNELLLAAHRAGLHVQRRPVRAIYGDEVSALRVRHLVRPTVRLVAGWVERLAV